MIDAQQLFDASQLEPANFGSAVDPDASDAAQLAQALSYLETQVLPSARSEVSLPFRRALNDFTSPLTPEWFASHFGPVASDVLALWDAAETSYGRSELNKRVDSSAAEYDKDSDQDRIQGNQRLQKLIDFVSGFVQSGSTGSGTVEGWTPPISKSVRIRPVW